MDVSGPSMTTTYNHLTHHPLCHSVNFPIFPELHSFPLLSFFILLSSSFLWSVSGRYSAIPSVTPAYILAHHHPTRKYQLYQVLSAKYQVHCKV